MKEKIWAILCDTKFKTYILSYLIDKFQKLERNINIFLVIASSSSIAVWAIWKEYPFLWSGIIAGSQVLTVIKPYLPYFKYVKELNSKLPLIENINIEIEQLWYKLQQKKISDDEAAENYFEIKKQITKIINFADDTIFTVDKEMENKANERMKNFLKSNYNTQITITKF